VNRERPEPDSLKSLIDSNFKEIMCIFFGMMYLMFCTNLKVIVGAQNVEYDCQQADALNQSLNIYAIIVGSAWLVPKVLLHAYLLLNQRRSTVALKMKVIKAYIIHFAILTTMVMPAWNIWSLFTVLPGFEKTCFQGYLLLDFINLVLIYVQTGIFTLIVAILVPLSSCVIPYLLVKLRGRREA